MWCMVTTPRERHHENDEDQVEDDDAEYEDTSNYRSCTTPLQSIIRQDLGKEARHLIQQTNSDCIQDATNYASDFSIAVLKIALLLQIHEFILTNEVASLQKAQGTSLEQVLPNGCLDNERHLFE